MDEAANLILKEIPLDYVKETIGEEKYDQIAEMFPYMQSFNIFMQAKNLGIMFRPEDISIEQLNMFSAIQDIVTKYLKEKTDGNG